MKGDSQILAPDERPTVLDADTIVSPRTYDDALDAAFEDPTGRVLADRYRIDRLLAQGAMGRVFAATQLQMDRTVAVKIMQPTGDPRFAKRFCLEASIASQLAHPNIVSVYDYGETEDGELFMVMEHCAGRPLSHVLHEQAPFPPERVLDLAIQIGRALKKAHDQGVVHRDLKPANIIIDTDEDGTDYVKVLDFGLVKLFAPEGSELSTLAGEDQLTRPGNMVGTPEYVSPEQALGDVVDGRTDVYALGVLMFQMVSGRLPFQGRSTLETITHHFQTPVPRIHEVAPDVDCPMELEAIIRHALAKAKHDRYPSVNELLLDLKSAWRNLTDESFANSSGIAIIESPRLPPIGLRQELASQTCEVDFFGGVAHEPRCLQAADIHLPGLSTGMVSADHPAADDPAEETFLTLRGRRRRARRRFTAVAAAVLFVVAAASGAYWLEGALHHAAPARSGAAVFLQAPAAEVARERPARPEPRDPERYKGNPY